MAESAIRILIVDDSALYRQTIHNVLREVDGIEIAGVAKNGLDAIERIEALDPDLLTLDVHMPDMDGIDVLREMTRRRLRPKAIMVSSLTSEGAQVTTDALLEGAFDFILKPSGPDSDANRTQLRDGLCEKIAAFRQASRTVPRRESASVRSEAPLAASGATSGATGSRGCRAVVIGTSTGGPAALKTVLPRLSPSLSVPVFVVQHMPAQYTHSLARRLDGMCDLEVVEPKNGQPVRPGTAFIAPGGCQMKLVGKMGQLRVRVTDDPHENGCRPAVDYLLRSVAHVYDGQALGVVLTGMGRDGVAGCRILKEGGGTVFAQQEDGCLVYGMPKAVIEEGLANRILPLEGIALAIGKHVEQSLVV